MRLRTMLAGAALLCAGVAVGAAPTASVASAADAAITVRNRAVMADFVDAFYRRRDVRAAFLAHVAPDYIQHNPGTGDGRDAAIAFLTPLFSGPEARFDVRHVIVDGDYAMVHINGRLDAKGPALAVMDLYRLKDGKIVEHWDALQPVTPSAVNPHPFF